MANDADGSLVIDTELDNSGFEKGSDKMMNSVKDLASAVDNIGDNMMRAFSQITPILSTIASSVASINAAMTSGATQATDANNRAAAAEQSFAQAARAAAQAANQQAQGVSNMTGNAADSHTTLSGLERQINSISSGMEGLSATADKGFANGASVLSFDQKLTEAEAKIDSARGRLEAFGQTKIPADDYKWLTDNIQKANDELIRLYDRQSKMEATGVKENSRAWQTLAYDIDLAKQKIREYTADKTDLEAKGLAFTTGADTEDYARMKAALTESGNALDRNRALIDSEALAQARMNVQVAQEKVLHASNASQRQAAVAQLQAAQQQLRDLAAQSSMAGAPKEDAISGWQRFGERLKKVWSIAVKISSAFKAAANGVKKASDKLKSFVTKSKNATLSTNGLVKALTSVKTMLKSRIKRMFISMIINNVKESMQSLTQFSSEFNASMSNIKNGSKELASNITVALASLITAIEPILTTIINSVSTAITYFNALIALLSGRSTVTVAKKQMDSYAESTAGAAAAAEELKKQTYGFDQLNKRSSDKTDSGGAGGAGGADAFETVDAGSLLPDDPKDWFERMKTVFQNGDRYGLGNVIAGGLNDAAGAVDTWVNTKLRPKAVEWTHNVAEVLNGLVDGFNWTLAGKTIADGIDTALDIVNTFLTTFNFRKFGTSIADGINGIFDNIEWPLLGKTLANNFNAVVDVIGGIVSRIKWGEIASNLATGFNNLVQNTDWTEAGQMLSDAVKGVLTFLAKAIEETVWQETGRIFADFIAAINWSGITSALFEGIGAALGGLAAFLWGLFEDDCKSVAEWLNEYAFEYGEFVIEGLLNGIWEAIKDVGTWIYEHIFKPFIGGFKSAFGINSPSTVMAEMGGYLIEGLLNGIINVWDSISGFFSDAWEDIKTTCTKAWGGIKNGVSSAAGKVGESVSSAWNKVKTWTSDAWGGVKNAVSGTWDGVKSGVSSAAQNVGGTVSSVWNNIKSETETVWNSVKATLMTTWNNAKSTASSSWSGLKSTVSTGWSSIKSNTSSVWSEIKSSLSSSWDGIRSNASSKWDGIKNAITNKGWSGVGSSICNGISSGINSGWSWLSNTVSNLASNLLSRAKTALGIHSPSKLFRDQVGLNIGYGIGEGIDDSEDAVINTVSNLATAITEEFANTTPELTLSENATVAGLDAVASRLSGIAATFQAITTALNCIGGFRMPQIAAGTVVPVKTRIDSTPDEPVAFGGFTELSSNVDERMADISYLLRQLIAVVKALNLNIDIEALTKMITQQQRTNIRNFGGV